ncbi:MAG: hypothetical protein JSW04_15675 [Desulfobacterales bacterium]|nr:MAG: hypothetical protein JSW04_15675 [Desulfobacterales bacterium]
MTKTKCPTIILLTIFIVIIIVDNVYPWHDETHIAIAKAAGYKKWFNAAGADMLKIKAGYTERLNHYTNNPRGTVVTPETVFQQVAKYNKKTDVIGHLYGAIMASLRDYLKEKQKGKYGGYHLAFCSHYVADLSQPLHNTLYNSYNRKNHKILESIINDEVLDNIDKIKTYHIKIESEEDLAKEIAKIANLSMKKGYQIEDEKRLLTKIEIYEQIGHSVSLFRAILRYIERINLQ